MCERSCFFASLPTFGVIGPFTFSSSDRCVVMYHQLSICILLMSSDGEHVFICFFAMPISYLMKCLFKSLSHFLLGLLVFLLLSLEISLHMNFFGYESFVKFVICKYFFSTWCLLFLSSGHRHL